MTADELFEQLNQLDEHERIEAKRASEIGSSVLETVCALSNEPGLGGGWILLGVVSKSATLFPGYGGYEVVGIEEPDKLSSELASQCASAFNQLVRPRIESATISGKIVLSVFVPELSPSAKPLFLKKHGLPKGAFRRIGSTDQHCTDDDLLVFYQERRSETFDNGVVPDAELSHLDATAIEEYRAIRANVNPNAEELGWSDDDLLEALGCVRSTGGIRRPTVTGILMFGSSLAIRRFFPMTRIDYIRVPGREWVKDPDRRFDTIEIRSPLIRAIRRAHSAVIDDLPKAFSLPPGELERKEIPVVPDRVIREAVVNSVMHRSYRVNGPIQIIRYANRLEIRNPGHSLKSDDRLGEPGSEHRNPHVAAILHETNLAETKGSGIRVMRELMMQAGLTPPTFESDRGGNQFVVTMLFHHFLSPADLLWLQRFSDHALSAEEARALVFVREAGVINNPAYRDLNQVDTLNASTHLRRLRDRGLLEMRGKGAGTFYIPTDGLLDGWTIRLTEADESQSGKPAAQSGKLEPLSGNLPPVSGKLGSEIPQELSAQIAQLPKRAPPHTVMDIIEGWCSLRSWTVDELAFHLGRNRKYVLEKYVSAMVKDGRLEMTIPEQPNNPQQGYRTPTEATDG